MAEKQYRSIGILLSILLSACAVWSNPLDESAAQASYLERPPEDEIIYFVIADRFENGDPSNDRGGLSGDRLVHGFDPTHKGFYHGGDLAGLTSRLDYIAGLGATAIWLGPIYKNKAVQGPPGEETAGYHGYWVTDFTTVDPHLGTREDLKQLVDEAHARGIKVYLDIITNHTADVIYYEECHGAAAPAAFSRPGDCPYRGKADYPYTRQGGRDGPAINDGFLGGQADLRTADNFDALQDPNYAYTPVVRPEDVDLKVPAWLNDVTLYHNRGDSAWYGENSVYGDFAGLDDLFTENPRVQAGFIEIYKQWITDFRIDGFRIDTAKHVNADFWPTFNSEMLAHARAMGIPNFYIFGEVYSGEPVELARFTQLHGFPAVLDFAFQEATVDVLAGGVPTDRLNAVFRADPLYNQGAEGARRLPTFVGSHDAGRFAHFVRKADPEVSDDGLFARVRMAHALMMFGRGIPVIYYGDEQGFVGDGGDQDAREDMFPSVVASYNDNDLVGTGRSTADNNFRVDHPLYKDISAMAALYKQERALRRGEQVVRFSEPDGGVLVLSRIDPETGGELLFAINASEETRRVRTDVDARSNSWTSLVGSCLPTSAEPTLYDLTLQPLDFILCKSNMWDSDT